jgi:hypothetical protein
MPRGIHFIKGAEGLGIRRNRNEIIVREIQ